jgi:DNA-binding PadR family transcriptional regulator
MGGSYTRGGFGERGFGGIPGPGHHLAEAVDQVRSMLGQREAPRASRGDVRLAILALLAEKPMHGYQIIAEIEKRSGGAWKPSAGSVYPTLQLLVDEGIIDQQVQDGRKTYSLTESGRAEADAAASHPAPWEAFEPFDPLGVGPLPKAGIDLAHAAAQVRRTGTPEQVEQAVTVLDEARRKLYSILAQD